jgi:hypothetical protein
MVKLQQHLISLYFEVHDRSSKNFLSGRRHLHRDDAGRRWLGRG